MEIYISISKKFHLTFNNHLIWTWNFNSKLLFGIFKINTSSLKIINWIKKWTFQFEYCYLNLKIYISILEIVI